MEYSRVQSVVDMHHEALSKTIESWDRVDQYAEVIKTTPHLQTPVDFKAQVKGFKFEQHFDQAKAQEVLTWLKSLGL